MRRPQARLAFTLIVLKNKAVNRKLTCGLGGVKPVLMACHEQERGAEVLGFGGIRFVYC
jgi:hypothetical protein